MVHVTHVCIIILYIENRLIYPIKYIIIVYSAADESVGAQFLSQSNPMESNLENINSQSEGTLLYGSSAEGGIQYGTSNSGT